jgi:two-component system chemotaxis response regulator CheB
MSWSGRSGVCNLEALRHRLDRLRHDLERQRESIRTQRARLARAVADAAPAQPAIPATVTPESDEAFAASEAVVLVGASAGGLGPVMATLSQLPADLACAVIVAVHSGHGSALTSILDAHSLLSVEMARTGDVVRTGRVHVCPPQRHVIVTPNRTMVVLDKPRVRFARPSLDWLFETAAGAFGPAAMVIVSSGSGEDGARGACHVAHAGGRVVVHAPDECAFPGMPQATLRRVSHAEICRQQDLGAAIVDWVRGIDLREKRTQFETPFAAPAGPLVETG